jgi:predicted transposase YbfD/YdcC
MGLFLDCFGELPDPRRGNARRHDLLELLTIALSATLCGAASCVDFELFARSKEEFLREFLSLEGGVPSHDTFSRLFRLLDPAAFSTCLTRFAAGLSEASGDGPVALDGKGLRCALAKVRSTSPVALVNAFASASGLALGLVGVPHGTGEIAALRVLLDLLDLRGRTVTADAMHCQRETAQAILDKGADYVLGLKANRFAMYDDAVLFLDDPAVQADTAAQTLDADHGRIETRCARVVADMAWLAERYSFPGLQALAEVTASREDATGQITIRRRLFVLSRPVTADALLATVRSHWGIENQLHWVMDVVFDEDRSRARTDNAPLNLAVLRRIALNLAKANTSKGSVRGKIKRAGWDNAFLAALILQMR